MSPISVKRRGIMFVLSSPSGAGKTTVAQEVLKQEKNLNISVSCTTRKARPSERDGIDYYFISENQYKEKVNEGEFLEHAEVFGNYYGTPKFVVEKYLDAGQDVIFDIDWQGTQQLAENARDDLVSIFILPPSIEVLEKRLIGRNQDTDEVVNRRMSKASDEMSHWPEYDYIIVNYDIEDSVAQVQAILAAERLKRERQVGLTDFVKRLREWQ